MLEGARPVRRDFISPDNQLAPAIREAGASFQHSCGVSIPWAAATVYQLVTWRPKFHEGTVDMWPRNVKTVSRSASPSIAEFP